MRRLGSAVGLWRWLVDRAGRLIGNHVTARVGLVPLTTSGMFGVGGAGGGGMGYKGVCVRAKWRVGGGGQWGRWGCVMCVVREGDEKGVRIDEGGRG